MTYRERMIAKLTAAFAPTLLEVIDDSEAHRGHAGAGALEETHFTVRIVSPAFAGTTRVARHRMIHDAVREELAERVHALSIEADPS